MKQGLKRLGPEVSSTPAHSCMEQSPQCSCNLRPIAACFQEKLVLKLFYFKVNFLLYILSNFYIFSLSHFDSCCGHLRDEHLLGVAFFQMSVYDYNYK